MKQFVILLAAIAMIGFVTSESHAQYYRGGSGFSIGIGSGYGGFGGGGFNRGYGGFNRGFGGYGGSYYRPVYRSYGGYGGGFSRGYGGYGGGYSRSFYGGGRGCGY